MNDFLYHYGVKGMKWGVRRYQNKDGSLTNAGRHRYSKSLDVNNMDRKQLISLLDSGRDFVIKKGQNLYRSTTTENERIEGKKYVSFRASDIGIYSHFVGKTYAKDNKPVYNVTYGANKNIKVAGARVQSEILQEMYGTKNARDIKEEWLPKSVIHKPISEMTDKEFGSYLYYNPFKHDLDILNKPLSNPDTATYVEKLRKRGYDAVVDMVDYGIGYSDGPMVILESQKSLKRK